MHPLNDPAILAEIATLHDAYEHALVTNDVAALNRSFWNSPHVVRYGVNEQLYGAEAIAAYRSDSPPVLLDRRILRRAITAFGQDMASVMCELSQTVFGQPRHSRQSQLWARFPEVGWKIVAAHVSHAPAKPADDWSGYVDRTAAALGVPVSTAHRRGVVENLQRAATLAAPLLELNLPAEDGIAPVFVP
ncbi:MAG: AtzH-like domain-containing protein [Opitutus sp.]